MYNKYLALIFLTTTLFCYQAEAQKKVKEDSVLPQQKLEQLFNSKSNEILVAAHRGDWRNAPENSLLALKYCIDMGVDIMELDLKRTKDGQLIVMHDRTIDRTTNGKGKPEDYTLEEIQKFKLKNGLGRPTSHQIPTFEEMLIAAKGKILIDVDKGYEYFGEVVALIKKHNMFDQTIINIDDNTYFDSVESKYGKVDPAAVLMPVIRYTDSHAEEIVNSYMRHKKTIFQPVFDTDTIKTINDIPMLKKKGYGVWINSLWASLNGGHDDDTAVDENKPDESWGWIIKRGVNVIQTDRPKELLEYLRKKKLHQ